MSAAAETLLALAIYNSWRRGDETIEMPAPAEIGATIDAAVNLLRKYDDLKARAERAEAELKEWSLLNLWGGTPEIIHAFIKGQQNRIYAAQDAEAELAAERAKVRVLCGALQNLVDEQNGAPLETRFGHWQMAMDEAGLALATAAAAPR